MFDFSIDEDYQRPKTRAVDLFRLLFQQNQSQRQPDYSQYSQQPEFRRAFQENFTPQAQAPTPYKRFGTGSTLMDALRQRESGGNYKSQNTLGYTGAYQFGAPALETVGYLKPGVGRQGNQALNNPQNWSIPGGKQAFLANKELQDAAMRKLMESNRKTLTKMGLIKPGMSEKVINAMLAAAHLAGPGGVKALLSGKNRRDAYGTGAQEYYNLGLNTEA
jgi:hypothetical protein